MVSARPPISNSSSILSSLWGSFRPHQLHLVSLSHYYYYYYSLGVFHRSLSDSKSQVFRTLLRILAYFNNAVVWMVFTRPLISKSSDSCTNPSVTVPSAPITIGIIVTFMFHSIFFNSLARSRYLSFFSLSFNFTLWSAGTAKSTILHVSFSYYY